MPIVDLSLTVNNAMAGVDISVAKQLKTDGWNATTLKLYSHSGTHMDALCHFLDGARTIDQQPLDVLVGPAEVINLAPAWPRQLFSIADLLPFETRITPGSRLLLRTDWHTRYGTDEYRNQLPRISRELAQWFVEKKVALLGVEPPSVADVNDLSEVTEVHQILFRGGIVIVEGLVNLNLLGNGQVEFTALPLKIEGGDGSPVRAIAKTDRAIAKTDSHVAS